MMQPRALTRAELDVIRAREAWSRKRNELIGLVGVSLAAQATKGPFERVNVTNAVDGAVWALDAIAERMGPEPPEFEPDERAHLRRA